MKENYSIEIRINDFPQQVPVGSSLAALIRKFDERVPDLIVELNGRFIYPCEYVGTIVKADDEIEFLNSNFGSWAPMRH